MDIKLKSCPFCGSEKENPYSHTPGCYLRLIWLLVEGVYDPSEEELLKAWNTRAERTCKQVITEYNDGLMPPFTAHCSECGDAWGYTPNYCPDCGAKVLGD